MINKTELDQVIHDLPKRSFDSTLFNLAHAYAQAADSAWDRMTASGNADFAGPAIMCQSFAIELLLKYFLSLDHPGAASAQDLEVAGVKLRKHKYSELYDQLKAETTAKIAAVFSARTGQSVDSAGFRALLVAQGDDPFVFWRYVYESKANSHFDRVQFNQVTDALGEAAAAERKKSVKN